MQLKGGLAVPKQKGEIRAKDSVVMIMLILVGITVVGTTMIIPKYLPPEAF
jgi:hypothetical protein